MECPRCNSKLPDNFKFCGFCGIELETGRRMVYQDWINQIDAVKGFNSQRLSDNTRGIIAGVTFIVVSLGASIAYPAACLLATIVVIIGLGMVVGNAISFRDLQFYSIGLDNIRQGIVAGRLSTIREIEDAIQKERSKRRFHITERKRLIWVGMKEEHDKKE